MAMSLEHFDESVTPSSNREEGVSADSFVQDGMIDMAAPHKQRLDGSAARKELHGQNLGMGETIIEVSELKYNPEFKRHDIERDLTLTNPNYLPPSPLLDGWEERQYQQNCQRCAPTYEMRCRGMNVEAMPIPAHFDELSLSPELAWEDPDVLYTTGTGMEDIARSLEKWGPSTRAEVIVFWKEDPDKGHAFMAENDDGEVRFIDPQNADEDCSWYFDNVVEGETRFWRTDNIEPSEWMDECCKECSDDDYLQ